jgi:hypothetical protein
MRTKTNLKAGGQSSGAGAGKALSILSDINSLAAKQRRGDNHANFDQQTS